MTLTHSDLFFDQYLPSYDSKEQLKRYRFCKVRTCGARFTTALEICRKYEVKPLEEWIHCSLPFRATSEADVRPFEFDFVRSEEN